MRFSCATPSDVAWLALLQVLVFAAVYSATATTMPRFRRDIPPIFNPKCVACHRAESPQNGLDLTTLASTLHGAESAIAIHPVPPAKILLMEMVIAWQMPSEGPKPSSADSERIRRWIAGGVLAEQEMAIISLRNQGWGCRSA